MLSVWKGFDVVSNLEVEVFFGIYSLELEVLFLIVIYGVIYGVGLVKM